jgi:DNA polymerase III subunit delta'
VSEYKYLQEGVWRTLTAADVKLPHALLFAGPKGVGKREVADGLAARLLCEAAPAPHQAACGRCPSCVMMASGTHPDYRLVQPEAAEVDEGEVTLAGEGEKKKASKQIRISQVRELEAFFHVGGHRGGARVCLIEPAEAMNAVTANSLLKILEEPSLSFYFLMVSHHWSGLLPTLLSRSRRVMFTAPAAADAQTWLAREKVTEEGRRWLPFFGHAPLALADAVHNGRLKVLESVVADLMKPQEPLAQAARWEPHVKADASLTMEDLVTTVQKWLFDLGQAALGGAPRYLPQQEKALSTLARHLSLPTLLQAQKQVAQLRAWARHPLNPRLFLEDLCVRAYRPLGPLGPLK